MQRNFGKGGRDGLGGNRPGHRSAREGAIQPREAEMMTPMSQGCGAHDCPAQVSLGYGAGDTVLHLGPAPANGGDGVRVNAEDSGEQSERRLLPSEVALADHRLLVIGQVGPPLPAHATFSEGLGVSGIDLPEASAANFRCARRD